MLTETLNLINEAIFAGLLLLGLYLIAMNMRTLLFPQKTGRIISLGGASAEESCKNCALMPTEPGKSTIPLKVRLENGKICKAEISPCSICIDRLKIGDPVGLSTFGSRMIAQKIGRLHMKEA